MNSIRPIVSVFLASIVLIASIGVTINFHLCAGQVQSMALFINAQPCKRDMPRTCHKEKHAQKHQGCCEEESLILKGKETNAEVKTATQLTPSFNLIAVILPVVYSIIVLDSAVTSTQYAQYKPPLLEQDITVLIHSYLI